MRNLPASKDPILARRERQLLYLALFFSLITNLLLLTGPLFMLQVYDRVLGSRSEETLVALFALVVLLFSLYAILDYARGRIVARVGARVQASLGPKAFQAMLEDQAMRAGQSNNRVSLSDVEAIRSFFTSPVLLALFDIPWSPVFLAAIFVFHPMLGWLSMAGGAILVLAALANQLLTTRKISEAQMLGLGSANFAKRVHDSSPYVWAQGMSSSLLHRWQKSQDRALASNIAASDWTGAFSAFTRGFRLLLQSTILALGAWLVLQHEMTAGAMIAASILLGRALSPIEQGLPHWQVVQRTRIAWRNLKKLLDELPQITPPTKLPQPAAAINVRNLALVLPGQERPVLRGITFYVAPGEVLGVIGKSGSGKTTLARILMGLVEPSSGEVRIGGATLLQYGSDRIGELVGYLPQEIQFFPGTIAENIAQMNPNPDPERVVAAAKKARVHDVILELTKGYDTPIDRFDAQLSGGQKQRLALARALYRNPLLLVLDEPNSALDADGSSGLNEAIVEMKASQRSVIIMTHRPSAITECDQLLVLEKGVAAGYGPRDEIIKSMLQNSGNVANVVRKGGNP